MKNRFRRLISWISLFCLLISSTGSLIPVYAYAAGEHEEKDEITGYITTPEEENVSFSTESIDYKSAMDMLEVTDPDKEAEIVHASKPDDEFPCYYTEDWLSYFNEKYPPTRDQGTYATCWAESAMSLAEFYMVRNGLADKTIDYSELHLAYWTYNQGTPSAAAGDTKDKVVFTPSAEDGIENILDNGGSLKFAVESLMRNRGFASEKSAPYSGAESVANGNPLSGAMERTDVAYLKNACLIPINFKPDEVKLAVAENGAAGIAIYADRDNYNEEHNAYYSSSENSTNHALTIVGWDDFFPGQWFSDSYGNKPPLDGAWLVRNSYSTENKEDYSSYFWLSYYDKSISGAWVFQLMDSFPWDNHYYYDSQIHGNNYYNSEVCEYANVFTVDGAGGAEGERLEAVSFEMALVEEKGSHYTIKIYGGLKGDTPDTGTLIRTASAEGTVYYEGFYTVSLNSPVVFDKGEKFAVVVSFDRPGSSVVLEKAVDEYNCISSKVGISTGQSFVSTDRESWADTKSSDKNTGNLVIAAMTSDTEKKAAVSKVVLTPESVTFTSPEESIDATVKLLDTNGEESAESEYSYVIWSSGNSKVAMVDEFGHITPVGNGQTRISAGYGKINASCYVRVSIPEEGRTAVPVADLRPDSELDWQYDRLKLSCSTPGSVIYYTLDGSEVSKNSSKYSEEISFSPSMAGGDVIVKAMAAADGYKDSETVEFKYSLPAKGSLRIPVPAKGTVIKSTATGYLSLQAEMSIGAEEEVPSEGFVWTVSDDSILRIFAGEDGKSENAKLTGLKNGITVISVNAVDSLGERLEASISISVDIAATGDVHISPVSGNYLYAGDHISISCDTVGASIYYTLDGSEASTQSTLYVNDIIVGPDSVGKQITVNAVAIKEGMYASDSVSCCYSVKRGKPGRSPFDSQPDAPDEEGYIYLVKGQSFYPDSNIKWVYKGKSKVVGINKKGLVTAKNAGMARIESKDDPDVYMDFIVAVPSIEVLHRSLAVGDEGKAGLSCFLNGIDKTDKYTNIHWFSTNKEVLEVYEDGSYKAIGSGSAKIAVCVNGKEYAVGIRVKDHVKVPVLSLADSRVEMVLNPLQSSNLKIKGIKIKKCTISGDGLYPSEYNTKGAPVAYRNDVIRITPSGKVTAVGAGSTTLILSQEDKPEDPIFVDVCVREPEERVYYMEPGKTKKIKIKGLKTTGADAAEIFSSNEDVVSVDRGKIVCRDKEGESLVVCSYKGFEFVLRVYVNHAELKTDEKLCAKGKDYELNLKFGEEPYELNWIGDLAQKAEFKNSDNTVAFMDQYEVVYIRGRGKTTLTANVHGRKIRIKIIVK